MSTPLAECDQQYVSEPLQTSDAQVDRRHCFAQSQQYVPDALSTCDAHSDNVLGTNLVSAAFKKVAGEDGDKAQASTSSVSTSRPLLQDDRSTNQWTRILQSPVVCKCIDRFLTFAGIGCWACCSKECPTMTIAARQRDMAGFLPLQQALALRAPEIVVRKLLGVHPKAAGQVLRGMTTLHLATGFYKIYECFYELRRTSQWYKQNKNARNTPTPLHERRLAHAYGNQNLSIVKSLIQLHPWMLVARDQTGMLPLHAALSCGASDDVVLELLRSNHEAAAVPCRVNHTCHLYGFAMFPVHFALVFGASEDVFLALLDTHPEVPRNPLVTRVDMPIQQQACSFGEHIEQIRDALIHRHRVVIENGFNEFCDSLLRNVEHFS